MSDFSPGMGSYSGTNSSSPSASLIKNSLTYESPFLDMTSYYMPKNMKELFSFITASIYGDGLVSQCISKLSEYPITSLDYDIKDTGLSKFNNKWEHILEKRLKIVDAMKQTGFDYYSYGTSLVSINYPFKRMLKCPSCKKAHSAESVRKLVFKNFKYEGTCPACKTKVTFEARDLPTKEYNKIGYIFWDLMYITIKYNNLSGDHFFYYTVPGHFRKMVTGGDLDIVNSTRIEILKAIEHNKPLKLSKTNLFHYKRPGPQILNAADRGWGVPVMMSVLKDIFYKRLLRKGNEAIAFEHIVPLRIIFPQGTGDVSPHATINLSSWKSKIEVELAAWKRDPNRITIVPFPVGQLNFGGDGKMLMVTPEIKAVEDDIITGIGIIPEIIRGGASWSGSNVSLRIVENTFLNHRGSIQGFIDWTIESVARYFDIPAVKVTLSPFKMADDMQRKQLLLNAANMKTVSYKTAMQELDLDPEVEYHSMMEEAKRGIEIKIKDAEGVAEASGAAAIINQTYMADAESAYQHRVDMHQREMKAKLDQQRSMDTDARAAGTDQEISAMEQQAGVPMGETSIANLILMLTNRFAKLSKYDPDEFKIRMLAMKNSTPNLYQEVYDNLREMNLIQADVAPNMEMVQKYTPGEIPQNVQGEQSAADAPNPNEVGASVQSIQKDGLSSSGNKGAAKPLPEAAPPRREASPI